MYLTTEVLLVFDNISRGSRASMRYADAVPKRHAELITRLLTGAVLKGLHNVAAHFAHLETELNNHAGVQELFRSEQSKSQCGLTPSGQRLGSKDSGIIDRKLCV
jgi:hypothetical protein